MSTYSLAGYAVALWQRTNKTILVEGSTDKKLLDRIALERALAVGGAQFRWTTDQVEIVQDASLSELGNKERVLHVAVTVVGLRADIQSKLNYIVDREWDEVPLQPLPVHHPHLQPQPWGFRTKGHSVENYAFKPELLADFLKFYFAQQLTAAFFGTLAGRYAEMLRLAVAVSLAAKDHQLIKKCGGLLRHSDVAWTGSRYELLASANAALANRQSNVDLVASSSSILNREDVKLCPAETLRWLAHGHIGEEVVRACAANLARELALEAAAIDAIENGRKLEKQLFDADRLASAPGDDTAPFAQLLDWLQ